MRNKIKCYQLHRLTPIWKVAFTTSLLTQLPAVLDVSLCFPTSFLGYIPHDLAAGNLNHKQRLVFLVPLQ